MRNGRSRTASRSSAARDIGGRHERRGQKRFYQARGNAVRWTVRCEPHTPFDDMDVLNPNKGYRPRELPEREMELDELHMREGQWLLHNVNGRLSYLPPNVTERNAGFHSAVPRTAGRPRTAHRPAHRRPPVRCEQTRISRQRHTFGTQPDTARRLPERSTKFIRHSPQPPDMQALVIVAHGSHLNPDSSAPTYDHADTVRAVGAFDEVRTLLEGGAVVPRGTADRRRRRGVLVPLFISRATSPSRSFHGSSGWRTGTLSCGTPTGRARPTRR